MAINLQKGQRVNVDLPRFTIGLGWDTNVSATGGDADLDASCFILGENKKMLSDAHFIFYNNTTSPNGEVVHSGDNKTGDGDGDDESIEIDLSKMDGRAQEVCFVVTIHDAEARKQNFGQVRNAFIRIVNASTGDEIMKYELDEDFSIETAVEFGRLYKRGDDWKFEAVGKGQRGGLGDFLSLYN